MATSRHEALLWRLLPVAAALIILGSQLFLPPIVGLADNADFINVTLPLQLVPKDVPEEERYFAYIVPRWKWDPSAPLIHRLITSEWLFTVPIALLVRPFTRGDFDLRLAALTHTAMFIWVLWMLSPVIQKLRPVARVVTWAAILLVICDVAYFSWFNSFYMDVASFLFLLAMIVFYARLASPVGIAKRNAAAFLLFVLLFLTSKLQHAILLPFLLVLLFFDPRIRKALPLRTIAASAAFCTLCVAVMFYDVPKQYTQYAAYNVIFTKLLPDSPRQVEILEEFDLSRQFLPYVGRGAFDPSSAFKNPYTAKFVEKQATTGALMRYYLRHPDDAIKLLMAGLEETRKEREEGFGNYTKESGKPARTFSTRFSTVSSLRSALFEKRPLLYATYLVLVAVMAAYAAKRSRLAMLILIGMAGAEIAVSTLADCAETTRHTFLFRAMMDLVLIGGIAFWAQHLVDRFRHVDRVVVKHSHA